MANKVLYVGELGNAKLVKNAMAMFAAVTHLTLAEICSWLKKGGLTEENISHNIEKLPTRFGRDRPHHGNHREPKIKPRKSWMPKDVGFGLDMAREMEMPMPFVALAYQMFSIAQATGMDGYEATGIACNVYGRDHRPKERALARMAGLAPERIFAISYLYTAPPAAGLPSGF
jgi:3-hydroxyisobutyrate dehydrogenase-like beta-hydroxyacid dehydrogenase